MSSFKIGFDSMEWQQVRPDVRQKVYCEGSRQVRLVEFETSDGAEHWCETGHVGYVLKGALSIDFNGRSHFISGRRWTVHSVRSGQQASGGRDLSRNAVADDGRPVSFSMSRVRSSGRRGGLRRCHSLGACRLR